MFIYYNLYPYGFILRTMDKSYSKDEIISLINSCFDVVQSNTHILSNNKIAIYIHGEHLSGKTKTIENILFEMGINIIKPSIYDLNKNAIFQLSSTQVSNKDVLSMFNKPTYTRKVLLLQNIENIYAISKSLYSYIIQTIRPKRTKVTKNEITMNFPIIITGNITQAKILNELQTNTHIVNFNNVNNKIHNIIQNNNTYNVSSSTNIYNLLSNIHFNNYTNNFIETPYDSNIILNCVYENIMIFLELCKDFCFTHKIICNCDNEYNKSVKMRRYINKTNWLKYILILELYELIFKYIHTNDTNYNIIQKEQMDMLNSIQKDMIINQITFLYRIILKHIFRITYDFEEILEESTKNYEIIENLFIELFDDYYHSHINSNNVYFTELLTKKSSELNNKKLFISLNNSINRNIFSMIQNKNNEIKCVNENTEINNEFTTTFIELSKANQNRIRKLFRIQDH